MEETADVLLWLTDGDLFTSLVVRETVVVLPCPDLVGIFVKASVDSKSSVLGRLIVVVAWNLAPVKKKDWFML